MSRLVVLVAVLAGPAWADIPVPQLPDTSCLGQTEGASCSGGGRCVKRTVRRPNFSNGIPPVWESTEVLVCEGASNAKVLVALLLLFSLALRKRGEGRGEGLTSKPNHPPSTQET